VRDPDFSTGDMHGRLPGQASAASIAAMEGLFSSQAGAPMVLMGQPDEATQSIDNPIVINDVELLITERTRAEVRGLDQFPRDQWPSRCSPFLRLPLVGGLGTYFAALMLLEVFFCGAGSCLRSVGFMASAVEFPSALT